MRKISHRDEGFFFIPLGVGDAFSARHYSSCLAVSAEGRWILIDCPHPIRKILREGSDKAGVALDADRIEAVVLTHLHADHASGLESLAFYNLYKLGRKTHVITHPEAARDLWPRHLFAGMGRTIPEPKGKAVERAFDDFFTLEVMREDAALTFGPFTITCRRTIHHLPTMGVRVMALGRTLAYSSDTSWDPGLVEWLMDADVILHETGNGIHTPYEALEALPASVRRRMRVIHVPDDFDFSGGRIKPLRQGRLYRV